MAISEATTNALDLAKIGVTKKSNRVDGNILPQIWKHCEICIFRLRRLFRTVPTPKAIYYNRRHFSCSIYSWYDGFSWSAPQFHDKYWRRLLHAELFHILQKNLQIVIGFGVNNVNLSQVIQILVDIMDFRFPFGQRTPILHLFSLTFTWV